MSFTFPSQSPLLVMLIEPLMHNPFVQTHFRAFEGHWFLDFPMKRARGQMHNMAPEGEQKSSCVLNSNVWFLSRKLNLPWKAFLNSEGLKFWLWFLVLFSDAKRMIKACPKLLDVKSKIDPSRWFNTQEKHPKFWIWAMKVRAYSSLISLYIKTYGISVPVQHVPVEI